MRLLILIGLLGGILAIPPDTRVGCENNPCQQLCIDTVDSYFCQCFENYVLQPDQHTCLHKNTAALEEANLGCFADNTTHRDLPYKIWTRTEDCTVPNCMHDCNARGYRYAGLQAGTECWCGNSYQRVYYEKEAVCDTPCVGAPAQICGGTLTNSVYKVTRDPRYMGCFWEDANDPDLPGIQWGPTEGKSNDDCVTTCGAQGYAYAGVFNGGQCACGSTYGKHGSAGERYCDVRCYNGYAAENCGGNATNAVYRVVTGTDYSSFQSSNLAGGPDQRATISMTGLFQYPNTLGIYAKRLIVYASDTVNNILDDTTCTTAECYSLCGEISVPEGFDKFRADVVIRQFYLKLSELPSFIEFPDDAQRVYVYAQTLYIDQSLNFQWSLYIRARQIIINYEVDPAITFNHEGPEFSIDIPNAVVYGAPSDITFQKLSLLCARMMISSTTDEHNRIGWNIIDDLVRDRAYSTEQEHFLNHIRALRSEFTSIGRNDLHWAPYYTQKFYTDTLLIYRDQIEDYNEIFQQLLDDAIECNNYVDRADSLITIWTETMVSQAQIIKQTAEDTLQISEAVYEGIYLEYNESREELVVAAEEFKKGLEDWKKEQTRKAMFGLIKSTVKLAFGVFPCGAVGVLKDLNDAVDGVIAGLELLEVTMENLAKTMQELEAFLLITDQIIASKDYARYMDNVEAVAGLYVILPEWANFKYQTDVIFREEEFRFIDGALAFSFAVFDLCNWGEALTRSMIEYANNIRRYVAADAILQNYIVMQQRYEDYLAEVQVDCDKKTQMTIMFAEQNYDIMIELNNQLIQYCEATYYEELRYCPEGARPNFAYSVEDLLTTVNQAHLNALYYERKSSARLDITIQDEPDAWNNCTDRKVCPMKMFRESRTLYYELPTDHPRFQGIDLFLVDELEVYIPGAVSTDDTDYVRLLLSSSGPFFNRREGTESVFITRALSEMKFQYDMVTGVIELRANLYQPDGAMIKHMTPFTTWLIQVDPAFSHIDISQVNEMQIVFHGPFLNYLDEPEKPRLA